MRQPLNAFQRRRIARIDLDGAFGIRAARVLRALAYVCPRRADAADEIDAAVEFFGKHDGDFAVADVFTHAAVLQLTSRNAMGSCARFPWVAHARFHRRYRRCVSGLPSRGGDRRRAEDRERAACRARALIAEREEAARATMGRHGAVADSGIAAWRAAYKGFGIRQTRYRCSVERLVKNVLAGRSLARVNTFVDSTMRCRLSTCCRSAPTTSTRSTPPLAFRYAKMATASSIWPRRGRSRGAEGRRGGLRGLGPCALPALELAAGRPDLDDVRDHAGSRDRAGERQWRCSRRSRRSH